MTNFKVEAVILLPQVPKQLMCQLSIAQTSLITMANKKNLHIVNKTKHVLPSFPALIDPLIMEQLVRAQLGRLNLQIWESVGHSMPIPENVNHFTMVVVMEH